MNNHDNMHHNITFLWFCWKEEEAAEENFSKNSRQLCIGYGYGYYQGSILKNFK